MINIFFVKLVLLFFIRQVKENVLKIRPAEIWDDKGFSRINMSGWLSEQIILEVLKNNK